MKGSDVVITTIGYTKSSPKNVQTAATQNIIDSMHKNNVKRLISLSGAGLAAPKDKKHLGFKIMRGIMSLLVKHILVDAENHYDALRKSGLKWTIARPPRLTDGEYTGKYESGYLKMGMGNKLSRADLAEFLLKQVESDQYVEEMPHVTN